MAQQNINVGSAPNDGTGDPLRTAFQKTEANFTELYEGKLESIQAGTNVTIDDADPLNPIVNASGGGGTVDSVVAGTGISVDSTDPANPVVTNSGVQTLTGAGVDNTDPQNPTMSFPDASEVVFTPSGGISANQVNDALVELDNDKLDKLITTNRQTASYGLVLADANKLVEMNVAGANDLTVPLNATQAFPVGTSILIAQYGAGQTTVVATGGVTIRSSGGKLKLTGQYSMATLIKIGTDEWYLSGDITT